jgi:hypothetical protein
MATSFDNFTPPPPPPPQPDPPPDPQPFHQPLPHEMDAGMPFGNPFLSRSNPISQPTIFNPRPFLGGVQLAPKGATTPGTPLPPSHKPNIIKPRNDFTALKNVVGFNGPPDSTNGMMIPLLIGGGILLIILIR